MSTLHELERDTGEDLAANDYWAQARLNVIKRWVDERHPSSILDIGCGSGYLSAELSNEYRRVVGVDIDPKLIEMATHRETEATFKTGDANDLEDADDKYDVVILADLIEHFENPVPVLEEARRVCRPDGHIIVSTPSHPWLFGPHDSNQGHARRYTPLMLADHGEAAGLTPVRKVHTNTVPLFPYFLMQRVVRRDVPSGVRGGSKNTVSGALKRILYGLEWLMEPVPIGITLIGEFTPMKHGDNQPSVLMTNYEYPPGCGGGGVFTRDLRDRLRSEGHEIPLVAGKNRSAWMRNGVVNLALWPFKNYTALDREIEKTDPDLIHGHFTLPSSLMLPLLKRKHGTPYVVSVIGADLHDPTRYASIRPAMNILNEHWVLKHADAITTASTDMRDRLPDPYRDDAHVIPYFVDTTEYKPGDGFGELNTPVRLLSVARLVPRKNLETAINALQHVRSMGHDATLTIVGDGSQREPLEAHAVDRGLSRHVEFPGYVDGDDLVSIYQEHDVFFLPSHHEGFGIVFLEAMACGLPVIGSDIGGQTDIITARTGGTAPPDRPQKLAREIARAIEWYPDMAENARERAVEVYDEGVVTDEYRKLYRSITPENGG